MIPLTLRFPQWMIVLCLGGFGTLLPAPAAEVSARVFDIPAGEALVTLKQFVTQSGAQVLYSADEMQGVRTRALRGRFEVRAALEQMLAGTKLQVIQDETTGVLIIRPETPTRSANAPTAVAAPAGWGTLSGQVSSVATRNLLEGALVELPDLHRQVLTDQHGRFSFDRVPAGRHDLQISYLGLGVVRQVVIIAAGGRAVLDLALQPADVVQMDKFVVATEREGNAAAITRQQRADNIRSVVAMDAMGILTNDNASDLLIRLAGVSGEWDQNGIVTNVRIRGVSAELNSVTVDGVKMASSGGMARNFRFGALSGALFDEVEVTKAATPEMDADSLGGAVNIKSRSALAYRERQRGHYRVGVRWLPPFTDQTVYRREHDQAPLLTFGYARIFDVGAGRRNLGVSLTTFYSENNRGAIVTEQERLDTTSGPSYVRQFVANDIYNADTQLSGNLRFDYRLTEQSSFNWSVKIGDSSNRCLAELQTTATVTTPRVLTLDAAGRPTGTGQIYPDFTDRVTRVRAMPTTSFEIYTFTRAFFDLNKFFNFGGEHQWGWLKLDHDAAVSSSSVIQFDGPYPRKAYPGGGQFSMNITNVGWRYDETASRTSPVFTQTEGPSIFDPRSYRNGVHRIRDNKRFTRIATGSANATATLPWRRFHEVKFGVRYRDDHIQETGGNRTYNYAGPDGILGGAGAADDLPGLIDPSGSLNNRYWHDQGRAMPFPTLGSIMVDLRDHPGHWVEDEYAGEAQKYIGTRSIDEVLKAAYLQGRLRLGPLRVLTGVRTEQVDVEAFAYVKGTKRPATPITDPRELARFDYNNPRSGTGSSRSHFPSAHLTYPLGRGLQARASWSNGVGRPATARLLPVETVNETAKTVTINNQSLKPQFTRNCDVSLEYYFEPVGMVAVGWFKKNIRDYIVSSELGVIPSGPGNGFNGDYAGYSLRSQSNGGTARIEGWEFSYQQPLTFLPGLLRGLGLVANYTKLQTEGNFGGTDVRRTGEVAGFVPKTGNAGLTYKYGRILLRISANYTGEAIVSYSANEALRRYRRARTLVNVDTSFALRPNTDLFCNVENVTDVPQQWYRYQPNRHQASNFNGTAVFFGVNGRF